MGSAPPGVPDGISALLSVLADPEKTKVKLAELGDAQTSMEQATAAHNKALYELNEKMAGFTTESARREAEISRRHSDATAAHAKLIRDAAAHQDEVAKAKVELEKRERELAMDQAKLNAGNQALVQRQNELTSREASVRAHEEELNSRHTILDDLHEEAMAMRLEAEKRIASLRSFLDADAPSAFTKGK